MKLIRPDYENSIMNVSNSFLKYYNVPTSYPTHPVMDQYLQEDYNHIIYILLDGMGVNVIKKHLPKTAALHNHLKTSVTSVFPPTTVAATNAVLSARPPISNGYLGWVQYFKEVDSNVAVFLNKDFYTDTQFDQLIRKEHLDYDNILTQVQNHNSDISTNILFPSFVENGTADSFQQMIEQALLITHNNDKTFNYLYWTQPDLIEHKEGIYSKPVKKMMESLNKDFESLLEHVPEKTLVVCIADHGLTNIEEINLFHYTDLMDMLIRKPSIEPRAINFFVKSEYKEAFKTEFNKHFDGKYLLFTKEDLYKSDLFGSGTPHPKTDDFIGDYIGIAVDTYMFSLSDKKTYKAHHAGLCEDEMMVPLVIYKK